MVVDETFVFKRKYHVGRLLHAEQERIWVVCGICRETGEVFVVAVRDRSAATLREVLETYVAWGTRIITDCWHGYHNLQEFGFVNASVNQSENFVDRSDRSIHTNRIERQWRTLRTIVPPGCNGDLRWTYLSECIWKQRVGWQGLAIGERIGAIVLALRDMQFGQ